MRCMFRVLLGGVFTCVVCISGFAQVPVDFLRNVEMESAWRTQLRLPVDGGGIVSARFWVDQNDVHEYAVVELPDETIRIAADQLDKDGNPIGLERAKEMARTAAARLAPNADNIQVVEARVPTIKLIVVTRDGLVQNLNAETGDIQWVTPCGLSNEPAHPAAVCEAGVVVVHGDHLYLLDWQTGKATMIKSLRRATANAVAAARRIAFVSDFTGKIAAYGLGHDIRPWNYVMFGHAVGHPVALHDKSLCAFATDAGYVYVYEAYDTPKVRLRFESGYPISGSLTAANDAFYVGDSRGVLTKFTAIERLGKIEWQYRSSQTITAPALVVGDTAYLINEAGEIDAIDDNSGNSRWEALSMDLVTPLAVADGKVFATSIANQLVALDVSTGEQVGRTPPLPLAAPVINGVSNRVYVIFRDGRIECLRPVGEALPTLVTPPKEEEPAQQTTPLGPASQPSLPGAGTGNPFGNMAPGGDPFGGGATGNDPFSTGGGAGQNGGGGMQNPFGADPFGTDG